MSGKALEYPTRGNIPTKVSEQLIVELYLEVKRRGGGIQE